MKPSTLVLLAATVSAGKLDARRPRDCTNTTTSTVTVTTPQLTTTRTVTVTATPTSSTTNNTTSRSSSPSTSKATTSTATTTSKSTKSITTTTQKTTTTTTKNTTKTSKQAAPSATSCEEIGDGNTHVAPNGKKWHVQCGQHYTGSNSILAYSDSIDNLAACMDYCSNISGARVVQYMESACECCANGGTGIDKLEGADAAYTLPDNS